MAAYKMAAVKVTPSNDFPLGLIRSHMVVIHLFLMLCDLQRVVRDLCPTLYKGKAVPLQAWSCPEGSRKLRFPDFMTTAQDGGKVVSLTHQPPLPPGNTPDTNFC